MFEDILGKTADVVSKGANAVKKGADAVKKAQKDSMTLSEDSPLVVNGLEIYPSKLQYKNIRCNFIDIEHIGWHWLSQTINVINTQDVRLSLYIRGRNKPIIIKKKTMYVAPKIVTAYNYIAKETFQNRLSFYTSQLEQSGGFTYDNCNIYSDGRVVSKGNTFNLSNADIEAFEITIKQGGLFSPKVIIDLNLDRDVILTLIDFILQNPQDPNIYIENHKHQKEANKSTSLFIKDIVSLMAMLSGADGHVSPEEVAIVKSFLSETMELDKNQLSEAISIFNNAVSSPNSFEFFAENLSRKFENERNMLSATLDLLFSIAIADGVLSAEEELLLLEAESIFGMKGGVYSHFKEQTSESSNYNDEYYYNVLGLSLNATQKEIRLEYKRLVMKFHPDRVEHLGEDFVNEAVIKMKEINKAYEYLRK